MKKIGFIFAFIVCCMVVAACSGSGSNDNGTEYATYKEALAANDFEAAYKILDQAKADHAACEYDREKKEFSQKYGIDYDRSKKGLKEAEDEIFNAETQFLAVQGTDEANKRLLVLLNSEPMQGTARSEGQELVKNASLARIDEIYHYDMAYHKYIKWCSRYNARCMQILDIAVNLDNEQLAKMMVKATKNDPEITTKQSKNGTYNDIFAHYTTKTKDEAIAKYEEHFGKFNEQKDD